MAHSTRGEGRLGDRTNPNVSGHGRVIIPRNLSASRTGGGGSSGTHSNADLDTPDLPPEMATDTQRRITRRLYHDQIRELEDNRQIFT